MRYTGLMDDFGSTRGDIPVLEYAGKKKCRDKWHWWLQAVVEQALILGLVGILVMMLMPAMAPQGCRDTFNIAEAAVKPNGVVHVAILNFKFDHGRYPHKLKNYSSLLH